MSWCICSRLSNTFLFEINSVPSKVTQWVLFINHLCINCLKKLNSEAIVQLVANSDSLSKACRNNSWSAWMSCRLGFLAAAIAAEPDGYKPLAFPPPELTPAGWLPPDEEPGLCGAILNGLGACPTRSED